MTDLFCLFYVSYLSVVVNVIAEGTLLFHACCALEPKAQPLDWLASLRLNP